MERLAILQHHEAEAREAYRSAQVATARAKKAEADALLDLDAAMHAVRNEEMKHRAELPAWAGAA
jgi:hypothetical protein